MSNEAKPQAVSDELIRDIAADASGNTTVLMTKYRETIIAICNELLALRAQLPADKSSASLEIETMELEVEGMREAAGEVERLRAIVDALPKTKDGAPLYLDQDIFYDNSDGFISYHRHERTLELRVIGLNVLGNAHSGAEDMRLIGLLMSGMSVSVLGKREKCFSTSAALAASREETATTTGEG